MRRRHLAHLQSVGQSLEERSVLSALLTPAGEPTLVSAQVAGDRAGDAWRDALPLGALDDDVTVRGAAGDGDYADWFKFSLEEPGAFHAVLTPTANFDLYLFEKTERSWRLRDHSAAVGDAVERVTADLVAGEFYLLVLPRQGEAGEYNLTIEPPPSPPPNETPAATLPVDKSPAFSAMHGYGQVNANAAVARAIGAPSLAATAPLAGADNWNLNAIRAADAWARGYTGRGVLVAVIDSGVDYTHPDMQASAYVNPREIAGDRRDNDGNGYVDDVRGWDFAAGDNDPRDENGHGTHVAGIIAAARNGFGVTGVAPSARILPVRVLDANGEGSNNNVSRGIRYAADLGADVINLSLGGPASEAVRAAIEYASKKGAVVVVAAGNDGAASPSFPAQYAADFGLAVGALDSSGSLASFSNRAGSRPLDYLTAPGVRVLGTHLNGGYVRMSGTSMAAPHVAGVAALVLSANRELSPSQVEAILTGAVTPAASWSQSVDTVYAGAVYAGAVYAGSVTA